MKNMLDQIREKRLFQEAAGSDQGLLYVGVGIGLFTAEHMRRMNLSVFVYGLLLAKVTGWNPRYLLGAVLKGTPLKMSKISEQSGISERTVRRHIKHLEEEGYVITVRRARGLSFFITNYRPLGKPNLGTGECPDVAVLKLSALADHGLVNVRQLAALEGINERVINTCNAVLKHTESVYLQPNAEVYLLLLRLFNVTCGSHEMRFFFTGRKKSGTFVHHGDFLKGVARALLVHERKQAAQERAGQKIVGIKNVVAYLNSGLHGSVPYLLKSFRGEDSYIERVNAMYNAIRDEVSEYKNKRNQEKGASS